MPSPAPTPPPQWPTDAALVTRAALTVARTALPEGLEVRGRLGQGSNNTVFAATLRGADCVLRAPRRRSDTQQAGSALWEFRHTLKAAQLGVGPRVYDAWYARHATGRWTSGLYLVTERMQCDLDAVFCDDAALRTRGLACGAALGEAVVACLRTLADELVFLYDLKPSNVMVRFGDDDGRVEARVVDFGRDFCEWAGCEHEPDSQSPVVSMLRKRVEAEAAAAAAAAQKKAAAAEQTAAAVDRRVAHVLFATMLVQLAATTTRRIYHDREDHRMPAAARREVNVVAPLARQLLDGMRGCDVALVRHVLRHDEVRGVMRHYHGRRNAGTRRTLRYARGEER